jgi:hypothetical protein
MSELTLLAALAAGAMLREFNGQYILTAGREEFDGDDLQVAAAALVQKELIRLRTRGPGASYYLVTPNGSAALKTMQVDGTEVNS